MTIPKLRKILDKVLDNVNNDINRSTNPNSKYSRGLAREGYSGGYAQAIMDVQLMLNDVNPRDIRGYWDINS